MTLEPPEETLEPELVERLEELLVWGVQVGWKLLGRPVNLFFTWEGLGYTHPADPRQPVEIYVNPNVLRDERGDRCLRGLILHELGHHAHHFRDPGYLRVHQKVVRRRIKSLFNLVIDEHMERRMRSYDPEWGEDFDALTSYAFRRQPIVLRLEPYARFVGLESEDEAAAALVRGEALGRVLSWEAGYRLLPDRSKWVSFPEFLKRVFDELARSHPAGVLSEDLRKLFGRLGWKIRDHGDSLEGIHGLLLEQREFQLDQDGNEADARRNFADVLEPLPSESADPGAYIERIERLRSMYEAFPDLERYVREMKWSRKSPYFWNKQRTMLFNLRRRHDFRFAFDPARLMSEEELGKLLGKEVYSPARILRRLLDTWDPEVHAHPERPFKISVSWLEVLKSPTVTSTSRFTIALRMGLGPPTVSSDEKAFGALAEIPRRLRLLDAWGLLDVTGAIARILGEEALDPPLRKLGEAGSAEPAGAGEVAPSLSQLLGEALEAQRAGLRKCIRTGDDPGMDRAIAKAVRQAEKRIEHWIRTRFDPAKEVADPRKVPRRAKPRRVRKIFERSPQSSARSVSPRGRIEEDMINLAATCEFNPIRAVGTLRAAPGAYRRLVRPLLRNARVLRRFFLTLGSREEEVEALRSGRRVDVARVRRLALSSDPQVLIGHETRPAPDLYVGIAIDTSSSMSAEDRMDKAKSFAALILEAVRGLEGVSAEVCAFTDSMIYDLGGPGDTSLARLQPEGGNNDAAGLLFAAQRALEHEKTRRLLVMISDGYPTQCSFDSLCRLVEYLGKKYRICSAQVAVDSLDEHRLAFDDYTDLAEHTLATAVGAFGRMIQQLVQRQFGV